MLADLLAAGERPADALQGYEARRLPPTTRIVQTNRSFPPDYINTKVDELTGGRPFSNIDEVISQDELRRISEDYKRIAGFSVDALNARSERQFHDSSEQTGEEVS